MRFSNTKTSYGILARLLHWGMALLYVGLFYAAYTMMDMPKTPAKWELYGLHKSFGLVALLIALTRVIWRWSNPVPQPEPGTQQWQHFLAQLAHYGLYALMFAMPLSGYVMSVAGGHEVQFFGLPVPSLLSNNIPLATLAHQGHALISQGILWLVGLHVAGALWHHLIRKDRTLMRMLRG